MKKILKNLILIVLILAAIFALTGCAITNTANTTFQNTACSGFVLPWRNYGDWHEVPDTIIISTHAELEEYCEKLDTDTNVMTDRICRAIELFNKYDENYFKNNSLAIACMQLNMENNDLQFNQATKNGDTVTIEYAISNNPKTSAIDDSCGFIVVEIDKQITNIIESKKE